MSHLTRFSIGQSVKVQGAGLHTGKASTVRFRPAPPEHGIVFARCDLPSTPHIPAVVEAVTATERRTVIGRSGVVVHTVEHLLAAVAAHGVDDLLIEIDGPEPPITDGSAAAFFQALTDAGVVATGGRARRIQVPAPLTITEGEAGYRVGPGSGLHLTVTVESAHPLIGTQTVSYDITRREFARELSGARTFGFVHEVETLRAKGLIKGGNADCAIMLTETGLLGGTLHWPDEFARHKTVDLIGDLALLGARFAGEITATRPSHRGNVALARAIKRLEATRDGH
jgi:UDP-3-O-acyl N-acetylglucosamine deacetylase